MVSLSKHWYIVVTCYNWLTCCFDDGLFVLLVCLLFYSLGCYSINWIIVIIAHCVECYFCKILHFEIFCVGVRYCKILFFENLLLKTALFLKTVLLWKTVLLENCVTLKNCVTWKEIFALGCVTVSYCVGVRYFKLFALL